MVVDLITKYRSLSHINCHHLLRSKKLWSNKTSTTAEEALLKVKGNSSCAKRKPVVVDYLTTPIGKSVGRIVIDLAVSQELLHLGNALLT